MARVVNQLGQVLRHDLEEVALDALLEAMADWGPVTAREILSRMWPDPNGRDVLIHFCPTVGDREPSPKSLGRRLRACAGRRVGGRYLADVKIDRAKSILWRVIFCRA